ncbi:hypothetical protein GQ53DRAFT_843914 [Thozetella sp. PMI_491]|nr:hypothetical protein GQ53DRAFT_843914 [Thozetella sp. PMI_491]
MRLVTWYYPLHALLALAANGEGITERPGLSPPEYYHPTITTANDVQGVSPLITPPPKAAADLELLKKRDSAAFIGYWSWGVSWSSMACPDGQYFAADSTWGACCTSGATQCLYGTACNRNTVLAVAGGQGDCGGGLCDTMTLFNSRGATGTGVRSIIQCFGTDGFYDAPRSLYRATFALTTAVPENAGPTKTATVTQTVTREATATHEVTVRPNAAPPQNSRGLGILWVLVASLAPMAVGALLF